jgi:DNA-binding XRE family transcriptional regulator
MTPDELKTARRELGLTGEQLARRLGFAPRSARAWEAGARGGAPSPIPLAVEIIVKLALKFPAVRRELGWHGKKRADKGEQAEA